MDPGLIGSVAATIGGVLMLAGVFVLADTEKERTDITGAVARRKDQAFTSSMRASPP